MTYELIRISAEEMKVKAAGVKPLPVEQSGAWDDFETRVGRKVFGRYEFVKSGRTIALISLTEHDIRGVKFLWAKKGPVWLRSQSPDNEAALREALVLEVKKRDPKVAFVRLHARYSAPDLKELINTMSYDRTVLIDTCGGDMEKMLAAMPKEGRRSMRRSFKRAQEGGAQAVDLTDIDREAFNEIYDVIAETANRNGFSIHPISVYWNMLDALRPNHARLYGVRYEGAIVAWVMVVMNDGEAAAYYGAHSSAGRQVLASEYLDCWTTLELGKEGIVSLDLMGVDSTRFPELYELGIYKRRFAAAAIEVDGAWDLPVHTVLYDGLRIAKQGKRAYTGVRALGEKLLNKVR